MFFYEVSKENPTSILIRTSEVLDKKKAKKYIKVLSSTLKDVVKDEYYADLITATFFQGMLGNSLNYTPRNPFCIYETEEEFNSYKEDFIKDISEYLEEKEILTQFQEDFGITISSENLFSGIDKAFKERGYLLQNLGNMEEPIINDIAIAIHFLVKNFLQGDIDSIFFINELL